MSQGEKLVVRLLHLHNRFETLFLEINTECTVTNRLHLRADALKTDLSDSVMAESMSATLACDRLHRRYTSTRRYQDVLP
jgi:hypothetical protein